MCGSPGSTTLRHRLSLWLVNCFLPSLPPLWQPQMHWSSHQAFPLRLLSLSHVRETWKTLVSPIPSGTLAPLLRAYLQYVFLVADWHLNKRLGVAARAFGRGLAKVWQEERAEGTVARLYSKGEGMHGEI